MKRGCLTTILLFFIMLQFPGAEARAQDNTVEPFGKGNSSYEKGQYDEAVREYLRLQGQGVESGNLYFNLGNSYFRKGELGRAILYYEKAKRLIPGDSDLQFNYSYVMSKLGDPGAQLPRTYLRKAAGMSEGLTMDALTMLVSVLYLIVVILLTAALYSRTVGKYVIGVALILLPVLLAGGVSLYARTAVIGTEAVVTGAAPEVKFEPSDGATTFFTLSEGMKVNIIERGHGWLKVERADGKTGWVRNGLVESID